MKRVLLAFLLGVLCCTCAWSIDYENWQAGLDDNLFLPRLSIPGTHDSGSSGLSGNSKTQSKTIAGQLSSGVRLFDLRPRWDGSEMYIYHGIMKTSVRFADALQTLCDFVTVHPTEFCLVMIRHEEDGASDSQKEAWPGEMYNILNAHRERLIDFSPTLTVRDMRGKILVLSRNEYSNGPIGGYFQGGGDNTVYDRTLAGPSGASMKCTTQDMYNVASSGMLDSKKSEIRNLLDRSTSESAWQLYFNQTSGYSKTIFGISTAAGIKECARECNKTVVDYMQDKTGPMGCILMDFGGDDSDSFYGQTLIDVIINNNLTRQSMERDARNHVIRTDATQGEVTYIVPMGADEACSVKYMRKDAASATSTAVDNLSVPAAGWYRTTFNDTKWETVELPMGSAGYEAPYRTTWSGEYNCYWVRRHFTLDHVDSGKEYYLNIYHDDDYKVYVNNRLIDSADGWTTPGGPVQKVIKNAYLSKGDNLIAVCVQQNYGGAYLDFGIFYKGQMGMLGDVNRDGKVNRDDAYATVSFLIGTDVAAYDKDAADMNDDGVLDVSDLVGVLNLVSSGSE